MKRRVLKIVSLALISLMLLSLIGCGGTTQGTTSAAGSSAQGTSGEVSSTSSKNEGGSSGGGFPQFSVNGWLGNLFGSSSVATSGSVSSAVSSLVSSSGVGGSSQTSSEVEPKPDPRYAFDGSVSLEVLNNYLNRAITYCQILKGDESFADIKNDILGVGAKYVQRAACNWPPLNWEHSIAYDTKNRLAEIHKTDPYIIFEACIFEIVTKSVEKISIPAYVFEEFGLKAEERTFDYEKMLFPDGYGVNKWGADSSIPDITRVETQMFFYYRGCFFIDQGFEALHLGQTNLIGHSDTNNVCWERVIGKIRAYAKINARRHYVIINGHNPTQNFVGISGVMLVDFNAFPMRISVAPGEGDHKPSQNAPQHCVITPGKGDAVYKKNIKGTSPSGWTTNKYPYLVEVDNWGIMAEKYHNKASSPYWGFDEITWFAIQPQSYRQKFTEYLIKEIDSFDENGHAAIVGKRWITNFPGRDKKLTTYYALGKAGDINFFGDLDFYKNLWNKLNK